MQEEFSDTTEKMELFDVLYIDSVGIILTLR